MAADRPDVAAERRKDLAAKVAIIVKRVQGEGKGLCWGFRFRKNRDLII